MKEFITTSASIVLVGVAVLLAPFSAAEISANETEFVAIDGWPDRQQVFTLGIESMSLEIDPVFRLFATDSLEPDELEQPNPELLAGQLNYSMAFSAGAGDVPEYMQMSFKIRTWDDYDGWEKTGYVLSKTAAAAGAAYILYRIFD